MKKNQTLQSIGSYCRILKGVKLPWLLILISAGLSIAEGSSELEVATLTGSIIDGSQNAINGAQWMRYIVMTALVAALTVATNYFNYKMEETITLRVRVKLWRKIMHLPTSFYDLDNGNELVSRVTTDASAPASLFTTIVVSLTSVVTVVQAFVRLYDTHTTLANYSLLVVPVVLLMFTIYSILQFKLGVYSTKVTASSLGYLAERVRNFRLIKSAVAEKMEARQGNRTFRRMYVAELLTWLGIATFQVISNLTSIVFIVIVFVIGGQLIPKGIVTVGDLTSFYMITGVVSMHLGLFFINAGSLFTAFGTMKKMAQILDTPTEQAAGTPPPLGQRDLVLEHVNFGYDAQRDVLKDLSVTIPAGKVTAVIGGNGAGKSTLFKLLTRLYEPKTGCIRFADCNIADFDLTQWRDRFAYVFQKDPLIGGTVRENLTYGLDCAVTEAQLLEATKKANCYDCIMEKPGGLDEDVGLGGSNFSGGQGQCISIARAMLRGSDILLLDEATSNLDVVSEAMVTEAMDNLMCGKTTIMIAHNYVATRNADYVIVLRDGMLEAAGTPEELLKHNAYYQAFAGKDEKEEASMDFSTIKAER